MDQLKIGYKSLRKIASLNGTAISLLIIIEVNGFLLPLPCLKAFACGKINLISHDPEKELLLNK